MKQMTIITIILVGIVLISAVQAFQLNDLKVKITDRQLILESSNSSAVVSPPTVAKKTPALPGNIANLPQMVGGC